MMTVGVNAKVAQPQPEAASGTSGGDGFAQLLTGIAPPASAAAPAAPAAAPPAPTDVVTAAAAPTSPTAPGEDGEADAGATLQLAVKAVADGQATNEMMAQTTEPKPTATPEVGTCMIEIGDLMARLVHLAKPGAKPAKDGEPTDTTKEGEGETSEDDKDIVVGALAIQIPVAPTPVATLLPAAAAAAAPVTPAQAETVASIPAAVIAAAASSVMKRQGESDEPAADTDADADTFKALDFSNFTKLAKPIELAQLRGALQGDAAGAAAPQGSPLAALIEAATKAPSGKTGTSSDAPVPADAAVAPAAPSAFFNTASVQTLMQPQLGAGHAATGALNGGMFANPTDLAVEHQLDIAQDGQWVDRLAKDIARTAGNEGPLRFQLNPEALGKLQIEVAQTHAGTTVRLNAETEAARAILSDAQHRLVAEARAQGVRIAEAHVGMNSNGQQADQRRQDDARNEAIVRTARGTVEAETENTEQNAPASAERFA